MRYMHMSVKPMRDRAKEKEIIAGATEGPWMALSQEICVGKENDSGIRYTPVASNVTGRKQWFSQENSRFIATARTAWPEDLAWRERAERMLKLMEWIFVPGKEFPVCLCCRAKYPDGHGIDCEMAALLGGKSSD